MNDAQQLVSFLSYGGARLGGDALDMVSAGRTLHLGEDSSQLL